MTLFVCGVGAHDVHKTLLTENQYDAVEDAQVLFSAWKEYRQDPGDISIATITITFGPDEIGQDFEAAALLAKKEAQRLGADHIYYVSSTAYKDTEVIASVTYRCIRTGSYSTLHKFLKKEEESRIRRELNKQMWEEVARTRFGAEYKRFLDSVFSFAEGDMLKNFGMKMIDTNGKSNAYFVDSKSGKRLSDSRGSNENRGTDSGGLSGLFQSEFGSLQFGLPRPPRGQIQIW